MSARKPALYDDDSYDDDHEDKHHEEFSHGGGSGKEYDTLVAIETYMKALNDVMVSNTWRSDGTGGSGQPKSEQKVCAPVFSSLLEATSAEDDGGTSLSPLGKLRSILRKASLSSRVLRLSRQVVARELCPQPYRLMSANVVLLSHLISISSARRRRTTAMVQNEREEQQSDDTKEDHPRGGLRYALSPFLWSLIGLIPQTACALLNHGSPQYRYHFFSKEHSLSPSFATSRAIPLPLVVTRKLFPAASASSSSSTPSWRPRQISRPSSRNEDEKGELTFLSCGMSCVPAGLESGKLAEKADPGYIWDMHGEEDEEEDEDEQGEEEGEPSSAQKKRVVLLTFQHSRSELVFVDQCTGLHSTAVIDFGTNAVLAACLLPPPPPPPVQSRTTQATSCVTSLCFAFSSFTMTGIQFILGASVLMMNEQEEGGEEEEEEVPCKLLLQGSSTIGLLDEGVTSVADVTRYAPWGDGQKEQQGATTSRTELKLTTAEAILKEYLRPRRFTLVATARGQVLILVVDGASLSLTQMRSIKSPQAGFTLAVPLPALNCLSSQLPSTTGSRGSAVSSSSSIVVGLRTSRGELQLCDVLAEMDFTPPSSSALTNDNGSIGGGTVGAWGKGAEKKTKNQDEEKEAASSQQHHIDPFLDQVPALSRRQREQMQHRRVDRRLFWLSEPYGKGITSIGPHPYASGLVIGGNSGGSRDVLQKMRVEIGESSSQVHLVADQEPIAETLGYKLCGRIFLCCGDQ